MQYQHPNRSSGGSFWGIAGVFLVLAVGFSPLGLFGTLGLMLWLLPLALLLLIGVTLADLWPTLPAGLKFLLVGFVHARRADQILVAGGVAVVAVLAYVASTI
jgi:hypothetical protein